MRNGSATALYDAIFLGSHALSRRQGRKVMVVITDGGDTMSQVDYKEALRAAQEGSMALHGRPLQQGRPTRPLSKRHASDQNPKLFYTGE